MPFERLGSGDYNLPHEQTPAEELPEGLAAARGGVAGAEPRAAEAGNTGVGGVRAEGVGERAPAGEAAPAPREPTEAELTPSENNDQDSD